VTAFEDLTSSRVDLSLIKLRSFWVKPNCKEIQAARLPPGRIDHHLHKLCDLVAGEIARIRDERFDVGRINKRHPFGSSAIANPGHDDISERGRDFGGRTVPNLEGNADRTVVIEFDLRRERKLMLTQLGFQFRQEWKHMLFHGPLAVLDVRRPLSDIVCCNFCLPILLKGREGNLCGKLSREFLGIHIFVP
jgi:hypothetical protein